MLFEEGMVGMVVECKECTADVESSCCGSSGDYDFGKGVVPLLQWSCRKGGSGICRLCHESLGRAQLLCPSHKGEALTRREIRTRPPFRFESGCLAMDRARNMRPGCEVVLAQSGCGVARGCLGDDGDCRKW